MEGLQNAIYKKLDKLYKDFEKPNAKEYLYKIIRWLTDDRSVQQNRMFWEFLRYLHDNVGQDSESIENFKDRLFINMKLYTVIYQSAGRVMLKPESVAFGNCSQKRFNEIFKAVQEYAETQLKINYSEWAQYYMQSGGAI